MMTRTLVASAIAACVLLVSHPSASVPAHLKRRPMPA